jgi:Sel1 repeat
MTRFFQTWTTVATSIPLWLGGMSASAKLGDTPSQIAVRYGNPIGKVDTFMLGDVQYRVERYRINGRLILVDYEFGKCAGERIYASREKPHFTEKECLDLATEITGQTLWTNQEPDECCITWNSGPFTARLEKFTDFGQPDTLQILKWGPIERPPGLAGTPNPLPSSSQSSAPESKAAVKASAKERMLKWHQDLAETGDPFGEYKMGMRHLSGDGVPKDAIKAREWLEKASAHGDSEAAAALKKLPPPIVLTPSDPSPRLVILSAKFSSGKNTVDVTERVRELLRQPEDSFLPSPKALKADPLPGKRKQLVIRYQLNGVEHVFHSPETKTVSYRALEKEAEN